MQFVFQPLAWGFLLVVVPLLVHLINLLRHRRQRWAAMEFLLESYRKHKRWVWMKQLLLLLSRMAVMAVLVAMLAQWVSSSRWLSIFGQSVTHHYVVLDDSMSMGDSSQGTTAYQSGLRAIAGLLQSVADEQGSHQVTILRYSRAMNLVPKKPSDASKSETAVALSTKAVSADTVADILSRTVPTNPASLLDRLNNTTPLVLDISPIGAIQIVLSLIRNASSEKAQVYIVSDFRDKDWRQSQEIRSALEPLKALQAELSLVDCSPMAHENLGLVSLEPDQEILAAGVPVMMKLELRNPGATTLRNVNVAVKLFEFDGEKTTPRPDRFASGNETQLPPVVIDSIGPGETIARRVQIVFSSVGSHVVQATLPDDPLLDDNSIASALEIVASQQLLVVDGDENRRGLFFLNAALNPGGMTRTGWTPVAKEPAFLRDASPEMLESYAAIVLLNVRAIESRALSNLETYVRNGGGLAIALGGSLTNADYDRYNRDWYRQGEGLLPLSIEGVVTLPLSEDGAASPDIIAGRHPVFASLLGLSNSPFQLVRVSRYVRLDYDKTEASRLPGESVTPLWQPIATLRDGAPLMVDRAFGQGRVVVLATALDPEWTNWPQDPTFVVTMLKTMGYLASFRWKETSAIVGTPIDWKFSSRDMTPEVEILLGANGRGIGRSLLSVTARPVAEPMLDVNLFADPTVQSEEQFRSFLSPGVTEVWNTTLQGIRVVKNFARNAPFAEGELKKISSADLLAGLRPTEAKYREADSLASTTALAGLTNRQGMLLAMLLGLLMLEQFLAWSASYHLSSPAVARATP
ncbi:MAG: BatA domain-containing protein [Pirellulaceae bacterium]|nr:BatA domain-containing protein [Pirellulaceae bacterium]